MDELSSCYFCGAAADDQLGTYQITGGATEGVAVTLCPTCSQKLDTALDSAGIGTAERVTSGGATDDVQASGASTGSASTGGASAGEPSPENTTSDATTGDTSTDDAATGVDSTPWPSERTGEGDGPTDAGNAASDESSPTAGTDRDVAGDEQRATADEHETANRARPNRETDPSVTKAEYRKVLRLLRNRDRAVDRAELESLATSAYGLTRAQCGKIIDTALERGHLEQRDGALVLTA